MADETGVKVLQLPLGENLADDDLMYAVEGGVSKKVEVSYLQNRIVGDVDSTPTASSDNLVTSGGVYNMVHTLDFNVFHDLAQISNSIADAFSASESYSEGDYVVYDYSLYKFTADKSAGAWDSSKATPVAVVEELGSGGTTVVPNPSGETTDTLEKLQIDQTIYDFAASNVYGEASGAIASFADGSANPLKSLVVDINPVQAGTGDPSPSNPRAIRGWTEANVTVEGKNLFNKTNLQMNKWINVSTGEIEASAGYAVTDFIRVKANSPIVFSYPMSSRRWFYNINKEPVASMGLSNPYTPSADGYIAMTIALNTVNVDTFQIEFGSTATSYEAYNADTETISLGQTVYGGKLNVTTGELTVDRAMVDMGTLNWTLESSVFRLTTDIGAKITSNTSEVANMICSIYETVSQSTMGGSSDKCVAGLNWGYGVRVKDTSYSDASSFKSAMDGVQLVYEIATPTTVTLTPTQVSSLLGNNNIWADSGDVDVVYIRNLNLFLNQLDARVKALENA